MITSRSRRDVSHPVGRARGAQGQIGICPDFFAPLTYRKPNNRTVSGDKPIGFRSEIPRRNEVDRELPDHRRSVSGQDCQTSSAQVRSAFSTSSGPPAASTADAVSRPTDAGRSQPGQSSEGVRHDAVRGADIEVAGTALEEHVETVQREDRSDPRSADSHMLGAVRVDPKWCRQPSRTGAPPRIRAGHRPPAALGRGVVLRRVRPLRRRELDPAAGAATGFTRVIPAVHSLMETRAPPSAAGFRHVRRLAAR